MSELDTASPDLAPAAPETPPPSSPVADSGSLADHEATYSRTPQKSAESDDGRDEHGRFTKPPKRRAVSQQADADDVPAINELTKRLKTAEETIGKDITRKPGESERVFALRRRAELVERLGQAAKPEPAKAAPVYAPPAVAGQPIPTAFPSYVDWVSFQGNEGKDYEEYVDARADWRFAIRRAQERQEEAAAKALAAVTERSNAHLKRVADAKQQKYPDWDQVVTNDLPITRVIHDAVLASDHSDDVQYYLGQHRDELAALVAESQDYSPSAVQAMRRYLDTRVAPPRTSPPSRAAAGSTGSALALAPPPAPRPPNPVRTSALTSADDPPGDDDMSLAAHEKFFGRARR